ncbi:hypothetical protein TGAMA5MH_02841 [Trichoderma gamsii]|uniref:DUF7896 domain-containing protein n=1 Tax=Trichoderma gamsii TaxID=398673 RepID=A0A2K0TJ99_9HYPO|nr:hypothetical protein TGAMA5MH_02841 [Trichoderma gamsii]
MFSAQNTQQMRPVAPRVQVSNFQFSGSNAAYMDRAPALNRGLGANPAFAPFEPAANNRNPYPLQLQTALAFPMQRNASIHSESSMPLQDLQGTLALASARYPHSNERISVVPLTQINERSVSLNSLNFGENPETYLSRTGISTSLDDMRSHGLPSGPPSMVSTSSVAERPWPMSRENSRVQASPNMYRMPSVSSFKEEPHFGQVTFDHSQPSSPRKASDLNNDLLAIGNGIVPSLNQYGSLESLFPSSASMEREYSNISINSTRSTASYSERRFKEATERTIQNGKTTAIAPMPQQLPPNTATSIAPRKERALQEGGKNKSKTKPPKLCPHCVEYPNGFRGDHELRRHIRAKHRSTVTKWICRDPGVHSELTALFPLAKCKACASGKLYGAYYNAAAHLRRTHFTAKPTRARGGSVGRRNGGRGGGGWPPMKQLKLWFREVTVEGDESGSLGTAHGSPDQRSSSLPIDEEAFVSATQMNDPVSQLNDTVAAFGDLFSPEMASNGLTFFDYASQSIDDALGLNMMVSGLDDNDIEMASSSQGSLVASAFQDAEDFSLWPMQESYGQ